MLFRPIRKKQNSLLFNKMQNITSVEILKHVSAMCKIYFTASLLSYLNQCIYISIMLSSLLIVLKVCFD